MRNLFFGFDPELLVARNGCQRTYGKIYLANRAALAAYAYRIVQKFRTPVFDVEDCVQEGFMNLWRRLPDYRFQCRCGLFLRSPEIFRRHTFDEHRAVFEPLNSISIWASYNWVGYVKNLHAFWFAKSMRSEFKTHRFGDVGPIVDRVVVSNYLKGARA